MQSLAISTDERFDEFQQSLGRRCNSLGDLEWNDLERFLDGLPTDIERVDFLNLAAKLPDEGVNSGVIINPQHHNRNQNMLLAPLRKKRSLLLSQHFNLQNILQKIDNIVDHGEALSYLWSIWRQYTEYHPTVRQKVYSPEELAFCNAIEFEIGRRKDLQGVDFASRPTQFTAGGMIVGDTYNIGQAGAVGPNANARDMTFNQIWNQLQATTNLSALADELSVLRQEMRKEAIESEHDIAISEVAKAEQSAKLGNGPIAIEHSKSAGKWALDVAIKAGVNLAANTIKEAIGVK